MKKNKKTGQGSREFENKAFNALKGYKASSQVALPVKKKKAQPAGQEKDEEADLFLRAVQDVKAIEDGSGNDQQDCLQKKKPVPKKDSTESEQKLFLKEMLKIGATFKSDFKEQVDEFSGNRSASSRMKQLKRGTLRIASQIDLHGYFRDEALTSLSAFIAGAHSRGQKAVLVITGKGINSGGEPVLRSAVAEWLRSYRGKGMIAEFEQAPGTMGGSGAFVVFLKTG